MARTKRAKEPAKEPQVSHGPAVRTVDDCAREARVSVGKIRGDIRTGALRAVKIGTCVRVLAPDWDNYLNATPVVKG